MRSGRLRANIFNKDEKRVSEIEMSTGDIIVLLGGGHGYDVLRGDTSFELKMDLMWGLIRRRGSNIVVHLK